MTIVYNQSTLNARLSAVISAIDAGAGFGLMRLLDSSNATVATITFPKPCGTTNAGVLTFSGLPLAAPLTFISGIIVAADLEDSTGTVVASGLTVGTSTASDIVMPTTTVSSGQTISLTFATITGR